MIDRIASLLHGPGAEAPGYVWLRLGQTVMSLDKPSRDACLTAICSVIGDPIRVFDRWPLWKPIGVSFEVRPERATGTGTNPLHIDVVNASAPPDYVAFFCDRADPLGGGHTVVANLLEAAARLPEDTRRVLSERSFVEGAFFDLSAVGHEMRPFAVIDDSTHPPRIRFTAKMLDEVAAEKRSALERYHSLLQDEQDIFLLEAGDLVIYNQWVCAHGRLPLGEGQRNVAPDGGRLIHQCFIREAEARRASGAAERSDARSD